MTRKLRPVLDGDWWMIGPAPDLEGLLPRAAEHRAAWEAAGRTKEHNCPVDHHVFQGPDGKWHLWGCVRATAVGRILYHWEADSLTDSPWRDTGEMIRCDRSRGECLNDGKSEQIQSPFFVHENGTYYMFFGGVSAGHTDALGNPLPDDGDELGATQNTCQMCLMTSTDGRTWRRYENEIGYSRLFIGPGPVRDPSLIKIGDTWHIYYAGCHDGDPMKAGIYMRTSRDLIHWSDWTLVHYDEHYGHQRWMAECPTVVKRGDCYYLFRTENYYKARTHIFRSQDPSDFGVDDYSDRDFPAHKYYVGRLRVAAPEIILDAEGNEYITSNHDVRGGTHMCRLKWVEED